MKYRSLFVVLVISMILISVGCQKAPPMPPPQAGIYKGKMEDGSYMVVKLVSINEKLQVEAVGYKFVPTGIEIGSYSLKETRNFGDVKDNKLLFQIPVMLQFSFSTSLMTESGGSSKIKWYAAEINWDKKDRLICKLSEINSPDDKYRNASLSNIGINTTNIPKGAKMRDSYEFVLQAIQ